jgi:hypothetical protein
LSFQVKSWGKNKLTIGREGFAVPEHFPTFKIFFPRLEGPFRRVASLAEIFHPLLWNEPFEILIYVITQSTHGHPGELHRADEDCAETTGGKVVCLMVAQGSGWRLFNLQP